MQVPASDASGEIYLAPIPSQVFAVEFAGLQRLAALTPTNATNWVTDNAPDLLFMAALMEAEMFLQAPERVQAMMSMFSEKVTLYKTRLQGTEVELYQAAPPASQAGSV